METLLRLQELGPLHLRLRQFTGKRTCTHISNIRAQPLEHVLRSEGLPTSFTRPGAIQGVILEAPCHTRQRPYGRGLACERVNNCICGVVTAFWANSQTELHSVSPLP